MAALTKAKSAGALALRRPSISADLTARLDRFDGASTFDGKGWSYEAQPAELIDQAKALIPMLDRYLAPGDPDDAEGWLRRLRMATAAVSETEFRGRVEAAMLACGDLPGWVWSDAALRAAMQTFKFFPTVAELDGFLRPRARDAQVLHWKLRQFVAAPILRPAEPVEPLTDEQRQQLSDILAALKDENRAQMRAECQARFDAIPGAIKPRDAPIDTLTLALMAEAATLDARPDMRKRLAEEVKGKGPQKEPARLKLRSYAAGRAAARQAKAPVVREA